MKLVRPVAVTEAALTSSSVAEDDFAAWSSGTTYALGDKVIKAHRIWESLQGANTNHDPAASPTWWLDTGATNRWRMFDTRHSSATTATGTLSVTIEPGAICTSVALLNCLGSSARIRMLDGATTICDQTISLLGTIFFPTWWEWFFGEYVPRQDVVVFDLPSLANPKIIIDIAGAGTVQCGVCLVGKAVYVAEGVFMGARVGIDDYSRKERNDYGDYEVVERAYSKRSSMSMLIQNNHLSSIYKLLADVRATPTVFVGSEQYEPLIIYGFYKGVDITIAYHQYSQLEIEIEGLT